METELHNYIYYRGKLSGIQEEEICVLRIKQ
jgi:hypothetical protein